ncbi:CMP-sialic acid transporter 2 [Nymphaea thermarum]|nr:CMP-sialic acid transporter 2 [Nymphaea thermarum]
MGASSTFLLLFSCSVLLYWVVKVVYSQWYKPRRVAAYLKQQGVHGPSYKLFVGNVMENVGSSSSLAPLSQMAAARFDILEALLKKMEKGGGVFVDSSKWKRKSLVTIALTFLTSSQAILIAWSRKSGKYDYSVTTANFLVGSWLGTTIDEVKVYPIPAALYLIKNLLQVMALLSGFAGVYTEAIIKKRPSRNINVQNFWLYVFGMVFNVAAIFIQDFDAVLNKGFFHGYSLITSCMILNHALSGIAVSMVMKYADNIVKVYSTSVAMLFTAIVSVFLFGYHLSLAFFLGSTIEDSAGFASTMANVSLMQILGPHSSDQAVQKYFQSDAVL